MARRRSDRLLGLLWADYRQRYSPRGRGVAREVTLVAARMLGDSNMHALALLRVVGSARPPLRGLAQRLLLWAHGIYVDPTAEIGPGLQTPHPIAITLGPGVSIGSSVALYQNVTLKAAGDGRGPGPRVGDGVRIYTGAVICGPVEVGAGAMLGAGTVVTADVAARGRVVRAHGTPDGGDPIVAPPTSPHALASDRRGLRELLVADHRRRFGATRRANPWRLPLDAVRDRPFRVTTIVRVMHAGPEPLWRLWRRALLLHGCDIGFDATIGAGLSMPCPIGVCVGRRAVLGSTVELYEHTCATPTTTSWHRTPQMPGRTLGDGVRLLPGAGAFGAVQVRAGATVRPRALVTRDAYSPGRAVGASRVSVAVSASGAPSPGAPIAAIAGQPGLVALVRSDLQRLVSGASGTRRRAALGLPFQAAILVRLATSPRARLAWIGRGALRNLHHCYVDEGVRIGPGLLLPLPCGIRMECVVRLGAGVTVYDRVSLRSDPSRRGPGGGPIIADGAVLGTGAVVLGAFVVRGELPDGAVRVGP